jgi:SOS-response transcriptional repressor LexA
MSYPLTKRQARIYEFVRKCLSDKRYSPTLQEIADKFKFRTHSTSQFYINTLIKKGWISRNKGSQIRLGT